MELEGYQIILFQNTHDAIKAEKELSPEVPVTVMPVPRRFSTCCGISLRFENKWLDKVRALMEERGLRGTIEELA